jgi:hypothetical protein
MNNSASYKVNNLKGLSVDDFTNKKDGVKVN